ncbi:MAG: butyrate kinase, partial [Bacilli bacterium]|nr:butyrate kinase [Bacilli bacterium]
ALGGDGPFSPERAGTLPTYPLVDLCFSGKYTKDQVKKMLVGHGGLVSYLGTANGIEIDKRIKAGDKEAAFYFHAMAYNVVKEIGSLYFAAQGKVDGILITGGLANNDIFVNHLKDYISPIKQLYVYPGEDEMRALAEGALRVLKQEEKLQAYV